MRRYLSLLLLFYVTRTIYSESCITLEGQSGYCVFIDACPDILQILRSNATELPASRYLCEGENDIVCCKNPRIAASYGKELSNTAYCGLQHFDDYTSNRNDTSLDEFPWVAAFVGVIRKTGKTRIACHGSLINKRYVLTDGICFTGASVKTYNITKVLLGEYHANTTTDCVDLQQYNITECTKAEEFSIEEKIFHPFLDVEAEMNTIALIRLNRNVFFTDYIRPICLPIQGTRFARPGDSLYISGWGTLHSGTTVFAEVKKKIKTVLQSDCAIKKSNIKISLTHYMCSLDSNDNAAYSCRSDIGGPVMFSHRNQWHIEGIVSKGGVCGSEFPGIHIRVTSYLEWIKQSIRP